MAFILEEAFQDTKNHYQLSLLAGKKGLGNTVSWVYQLEETSIIEHFWGNELVVTMGVGFQNTQALLDLIDQLIAQDASGLFINLSPYLHEISKEVIEYCEARDFPLVTFPWEIVVADLIKEYCIRVFRVENEQKELSDAFIQAIEAPMRINEYTQALSKNYKTMGQFQVALLEVEQTGTVLTIQQRKLLFGLRRVLDHMEARYSIFWYLESYVLIVNDMSQEKMLETIHNIIDITKLNQPDMKLHIGYGSMVENVSNVASGYKRALAALRMCKLRGETLYGFDEMGVYQILFSIDDRNILTNLYQTTLAALIAYDEEHHTNYEETLYYYLKYNGSIQNISDAMFTHRNTIMYRMKKIKELLGKELEDTEERFPYQVAFYIKEMI